MKHCPGCGRERARAVYSVEAVPVHAVLLFDSREEARAHPSGRIDLAFCRGCGLLFNGAFEPERLDYTGQCEESQAFSPTFTAFARGLARDLVQRHGLDDGTVLEIGCGKGDMLAMLLEAGVGRAHGVDPGFDGSRIPAELRERIVVHQEEYAEHHAELPADLVLCRHTLEHVSAVGRFLRLLRTNLEQRPDTPVVLEVPDAGCILAEGAFWDVYYEHCNYFTGKSLTRLLRTSGFDVLDVELVYGDQYLLLTAMPIGGAPGKSAAQPARHVVDPREEYDVEEFARGCMETALAWRRRIRQRAGANGPVVLWGAGSKAVGFLATLGLDEEVACIVDVNPHKQGKFQPGTGHEIVEPARLREIRPGCVVAMNPIYREEIRKDLDRLGVRAELLAL